MPSPLKTAAAVVAVGAGASILRAKTKVEPGRGPWDPKVDRMENYDYIILGGGTAGCVVASRLAEDPNVNVLILEAGFSDEIPGSKMPMGYTKLPHTAVDWDFTTVPQVYCNNRIMVQPRGKVLGGSSSINAMMYHRGPKDDYDLWAELGNEGWNYTRALHYFKKSEGFNDPNLPASHPKGPIATTRIRSPSHETFEPEYHGTDGPWQVTYHHLFGASKGFIRANVAVGVPFNKDFNGTTTLGVNRVQTFIQRNAVRSSAARAFMAPDLVNQPGRGKIRTVYGAKITRVLLQERRGKKVAIGAEFFDKNHNLQRITAVREVILCAGAFMSPHILLASGIGPTAHPVIPHLHTLAGVGKNLQDHIGLRIIFRAHPNCDTLGAARSLWKLPMLLYKYQRYGTGPLSSQGAESANFLRLEQIAPEFVAREKAAGTWREMASGPDAPHLEIIFVPGYLNGDFTQEAPNDVNYVSMCCLLLNPASVGEVTISPEVTKNGKLETRINPNYYSDPFDMRVQAEGLKFMRKLGRQMAMDKEMIEEEVLPGLKAVPEDDQEAVFEYIRNNSNTYYHPTTTCKMGPATDSMAVVDSQLRVHGIDRLRIVDASVMPRIPAAHTCASTIMIAETAADLIKDDWKASTGAEVQAKL